MHSCLYHGAVRHRRFTPTEHQFRYSLFQSYLDLDELDQAFARRWFWSVNRPNVASFRREDHVGPIDQPLAETVRQIVARETGHRPGGPIRLLTHLRYFGVVMNPVSFYFCFDEKDSGLEAVVLEVHNTPWNERHCYVIALDAPEAARHRFRFQKAFHVSPFMNMDHEYRCVLSRPGDHLNIHLENWRDGEKIFDASLQLKRRPHSGPNLAWALAAYPLMPLKIVCAIYWQALRLWWKGTPYCPHPNGAGTKEINAHE